MQACGWKGVMALASAAGMAPMATAQCVEWLEYLRTPGFVETLTFWDPDGDGPRGPLLVAGGRMSWTVSGQLHRQIVGKDLATGELYAFGGGLWDTSQPNVRALAVLHSGELVAAGIFNMADNLVAFKIAKWDGARWSPLDAGVALRDGDGAGVYDLAVLPNGDLIAAGRFDLAGGSPAANIARWDGTQWHALGSGLSGLASHLAAGPNGGVYAAGSFLSAGGAPADGLAMWDGEAWHPLDPVCDYIQDMTTLATGELCVLARCDPPASRVNAWRRINAGWELLNPGTTDGSITSITALASGGVFVSGYFRTIDGVAALGSAAWREGDGWSPSGWMRTGAVEVAESPDGELFACGSNLAPMSSRATVVKLGAGRPVEPLSPQVSEVRIRRGSLATIWCSLWGMEPLAFSWSKDGTVLTDLPDRVSGSAAPTLRLQRATVLDEGLYTCEVSNMCNALTSEPTRLIVCIADYNADDFADFFDYADFVDEFEHGVARADVNEDGFLDFFDYADFVSAFESGC